MPCFDISHAPIKTKFIFRNVKVEFVTDFDQSEGKETPEIELSCETPNEISFPSTTPSCYISKKGFNIISVLDIPIFMYSAILLSSSSQQMMNQRILFGSGFIILFMKHLLLMIIMPGILQKQNLKNKR